jgi:hypothetical protein
VLALIVLRFVTIRVTASIKNIGKNYFCHYCDPPMKEKSHARALDKRNFSVALPIKLIDAIEQIANAENRSRNRQIETFLQEQVRQYHAEKAATAHPAKRPPSAQNRIATRTGTRTREPVQPEPVKRNGY